MARDQQLRQRKILELVATRPIRTQEDLAAALHAAGWDVTQSSVSRDIAQLHLVKVDGVYRRGPRPLGAEKDPDLARIRDGVIGIDVAGDVLLVLHTPPGEATRTALALDRQGWKELAGTIAGDDTIFVAARDASAQRRLLTQLRGIVR